MRRRSLYVLMFAVPAALAAVVAALGVVGALAGVLWIFVLGDNPWPPAAEALLVAAFALTALGCWLMLVRLAYAAGRKAEAGATFNRRHAVSAAAATAILVAVIVAHQWSVGNIGTPSDGVRCMELCRAEGFDASAMPPRDSGRRTCQCLDATGRVAREAALAPANESR